MVGSVAGDSVVDTDIAIGNITGYRALGVIGFNINAGGGCGMVSCRLVGSGSNVNCKCRIRNNSSSQTGANTEVRVYVLFIKN